MWNSVFQIQWPVFRLSTHLPLCIHTQSSHYNQILALSFSECQENEAPWDVFRMNNLFNLSSVLNYKEVRDCCSTIASCHCQIIDYSNLRRILCLVYNCNYGLVRVPLQDLFVKCARIQNFRKTNCLNLPKLHQNLISYKGTAIWNCLLVVFSCSVDTEVTSFRPFPGNPKLG